MSEVSGLGSIDKIVLSTRQGECVVELMCGDITLLPLKDKVDVILISAFQNDYSMTNSRTVIGSLYQTFRLDVDSLSKSKQVDLRRNFSCWVSKPLPERLPYRRLVCFERIYNSGTVTEQIANIYRAFTPIFNNEDTTVISPLLATGNQGQCSEKVIQAMVDGACGWILSGLPLRHLKLVVYSKNVHEIYKRDVNTVQLFRKLKAKWENICKQKLGNLGEVSTYDVYLSYSPDDESPTSKIISRLKQVKPSIKLFSKIMSFQNDEVWQEKIFDVMVKSKRIIVILSPAYIASEECLEQFNMAMCCNRLKKKQILAPFYMETIPSLPAYMLLVQYVECRIRKESDDGDKLITSACKIVVKAMDGDVAVETPETVAQTPKYDVFISYAHRSPKEAELLFNLLKSKNPLLNIFFDKRELSTGSVWQKTLYESLDTAGIIITFISDSYIKSTVCQEEYNIALARHLSQDNVCFVPVCCDDIEFVPPEFSHVPMLDLRHNKDQCLEKLANNIMKYNAYGFNRELCFGPSISLDINVVLEEIRTQQFHQFHKIAKQKIQPKNTMPEKKNIKIVFSFSQDCLKYAAAISQFVEDEGPSIQCIFISENNSERLSLLDKADRIVILISKQYIQSCLLMEEFHISMCRQRASPENTILYLIQTSILDVKPTYMTILPYSVALNDDIWSSLMNKKTDDDRNYSYGIQIIIKRIGIAGSYSFARTDLLALQTVAVDLRYGLPDRREWLNILNLMTIDNKSQPVQLHKCLKFENDVDEDKTGEDKTGEDKTDEDKTGEDKTGEDKTGEDKTGDDKTGEDKTDGNKGDKNSIDDLQTDVETRIPVTETQTEFLIRTVDVGNNTPEKQANTSLVKNKTVNTVDTNLNEVACHSTPKSNTKKSQACILL